MTLLLLLTALRENNLRARLMSGLLLLLFSLAWCLAGIGIAGAAVYRSILSGLFWTVAVLFFLPIGKRRPIQVIDCTQRVDERDVIFSREEYVPGTRKYEVYYNRHPGFRATDDRIRQQPALLTPGGIHYEPELAKLIRQDFDRMERLGTEVDGPRVEPSIEARTGHHGEPSAAQLTEWAKRRSAELGADAVGIALLETALPADPRRIAQALRSLLRRR